jgi:cyanophycin synthetase
MVLSAPGDRRDDDIRATARAAAAGGFDHYVVRRDDNPRGRGDDEVPRLIAETLRGAGVRADAVEIVVREAPAIDRALALAERGDLVIICADQLERGWAQIEGFGLARAAGAAPGGTGAGDAADAPRAHPHDEAPAEDAGPPPDASRAGGRAGEPPPTTARATSPADGAPASYVRDARGVVLAREVDD